MKTNNSRLIEPGKAHKMDEEEIEKVNQKIVEELKAIL